MNIFFRPPFRPGQGSNQRNILRNAVVRTVTPRGRNEGSIMVDTQDSFIGCDCLVLNVNRLTRIRGPRGRLISITDIMPGMRIDAEYSDFMTPSRPPQVAAISITVRNVATAPPPSGRQVQTGRIIDVNPRGGYIITGNPNDPNSQMRFNVNRQTQVLNRNGRRITLAQLRPGDRVRVTHAPVVTMSIPPQSPAYVIQLL